MKSKRALLMTVGTGDRNAPGPTLYEPMKKSVKKREYEKVVLLPSQETLGNARSFQRELSEIQMEIHPLEREGQENNPDACYAHFDRVVNGLLEEGYAVYDITVDFTRGTKAMSAALVLAAVRHDISVLRYLTGERDSRGTVEAGSEEISEFATTHVTAGRILDAAYRFFSRGDFAGVLNLIPDMDSPFSSLWPRDEAVRAGDVLKLADFYSKWDRLDYRAAAGVLENVKGISLEGRWERFNVSGKTEEWVRRIACKWPDDMKQRAVHTRCLAADILANGERRIRDGHYEDAVIRAYRVLELIGQARLFDLGLDSGNLDPENEYVKRLERKLSKKKSYPLERNKEGRPMAGREQVMRLLKIAGDTLSERLNELGNKLFIKTRNKHVLIHGFESIAPTDVKLLRDYYTELSKLLMQDGGEEASRRLETARSLDFS